MKKGSKIEEDIKKALTQGQRWVGELLRKRAPAPSDASGAMTMPPAATGDRAFQLSGVLVLLILLLAAAFGGILGLRLYSVLGMGQNRVKNVPVVYLQGEDALKLWGPLLEQPVTVTRLTFDSPKGYDLEKNTELSEDGKKLLYLDRVVGESGVLYLRDTTREKPWGNMGTEGKVIASGVQADSFLFMEENNSVLYVKRGPSGRSLYRWHSGKEQLLESGLVTVLGMSEEEYLYYTVTPPSGDAAGTYDLHRINASGMPEVLAGKLDGRLTQLDPVTGMVLYSQARNSVQSSASFTLNYWNGSEPAFLAQNVDAVTDYGGAGLVFYTSEVMQAFDPYQYFEDDKAAGDAAMEEPMEAVFMVETTNLWGGKKTALDKKAYEQAVADYEAKENRDNIRTALTAQARGYRRQNLRYNAGAAASVWNDNILQVVDADAAAGVAVYVKERITAPQKFKISQVADPNDALRLLNTVLISEVRDYYYASVGRESEQFLSITKNEKLHVALDGGKGLYYLKEDAMGGGAPLNYISAQEDGLGIAKKVDDQVLGLTDLRYKGQLLYLRGESTEDTVTLCGAQGGAKTRLVDGAPASPLPVVYDEALLCYRNYDAAREQGDLTLYSDKVRPVGRAVSHWSYRLPGYVYLLKEYDPGLETGILCLYTGNSEKLTLVDRNVSAIAE